MAQTFTPQGLPVHNESVSNVTLTNSVSLGETRFLNGEEYLYVYNAGAQQISVGNFAVLSANSGFSVTISSITGYDLPIGFCKHATITTGAYGWLLTRGFTKALMTSNQSASTSDILFPGTQGTVGVLGQAVSSITGQIFQPIGYVVSGAASGSSCFAYVRCYGT